MSKKVLLAALGAIVVVVAIGALLVPTQLDRFVGTVVEEYGRAATGTDVAVGGVDIALTEGTGELRELTIDNPAGFDTDYALKINDVRLQLELSSLSRDVPVVAEMLLDDAHVNAEQRGDATNLTEIQNYMSEPDAEALSSSPEDSRIIIDRFRLTNARVTLTSELLSEPEDLELRDISVDGIGRASGGATYDEAAQAILTPILAAARSAVQERLRSAAADAAREEVQEEVEEEVGESLQDLLDRE